MTHQEMLSAQRGDKIKHSGYEGIFIVIYDMCGLVEIRLPGGLCCVPIEDVELVKEDRQ